MGIQKKSQNQTNTNMVHRILQIKKKNFCWLEIEAQTLQPYMQPRKKVLNKWIIQKRNVYIFYYLFKVC